MKMMVSLVSLAFYSTAYPYCYFSSFIQVVSAITVRNHNGRTAAAFMMCRPITSTTTRSFLQSSSASSSSSSSSSLSSQQQQQSDDKKLPSLTYTLNDKPRVVYVPITSYSNTRTLPETRGPNFTLPTQVVGSLCRFRDLEIGDNNANKWTNWWSNHQLGRKKAGPRQTKLLLPPPIRIPKDSSSSSLEYNPIIVHTLMDELEYKYNNIDTMVIAGEGEPTLRSKELIELLQQFTSRTKVPKIRITTNGLVGYGVNDNNIANQQRETLLTSLKDVGITHISVSIMTSNKHQYKRLMIAKDERKQQQQQQQHDKSRHHHHHHHHVVCSFIKQAVDVGFDVETTAIDRPDVVDKHATELFVSNQLNVDNPIRWRTYFE